MELIICIIKFWIYALGDSFGPRRPPLTKIIKGILERYPDGGQILKVITKLILKIYLYINVYIYIYIVQSTDTCFTVPQLISVAWNNLNEFHQLL